MLTQTGVDDEQLAVALREAARATSSLHVVVDSFRSAVFARDAASGEWRCVGSGDLAAAAIEVIRTYISKIPVLFSKVMDVSAIADWSFLKSAIGTKATVTSLKTWVREKADITAIKGRQGGLSTETKRHVERQAQWRCQFEGCGVDLREHSQSGLDGNFSYLAHIVAASPDGPRGHAVLSAQLVDEPTNIMLMCDRCHRLIDRVAPDSFPPERLQAMRAAHIAEANRLLDGLRFPAADAVVIGGNISGQYSQFDAAAIEAAMREQKMRPYGPPRAFFRNAAHMGNNVAAHYWTSLFEQMGADVPAFRRFLNGDERGGVTPEQLCLFPLHNMSTLVLAGRIAGEARELRIFQYDRDGLPNSPGGKWGWKSKTPPASTKYRVDVDYNNLGSAEAGDAALLVYITAAVPTAELPSVFQRDGEMALPTVRISIEEPNYSAISHPDDLQLFGVAVSEALRILNDMWRPQRIHIVLVAPASACFRFGQKLQARNQCATLLYERTPTSGATGPVSRPFAPTIEILSDAVRLPDGTHAVALL